MQQELAEAGITVTIETVDSATLFAGMADGKYDMAIASHTPGALPLWFTESRFTADNNLFHVAEPPVVWADAPRPVPHGGRHRLPLIRLLQRERVGLGVPGLTEPNK